MEGNEDFFTYLDTLKISKLIKSATESVIYAAPGVRAEVANSLIQASENLSKVMVTVCLDVCEQSIRMGFGDFEAVSNLDDFVVINNIPNLRFALIIIDGQGYSFSPTALYLESEQSTSLGFNAIKLTEQQVQEATTRLSPAAKAIALATCETEEQREKIAATIPEIPNNPLNEQEIKSIDNSIKNNPLVKFDVTRQVRVYSSYLQYVELSMTGAAIQRQKISMPKSLQALGTANTELEGRFKTSFDLLAKDNALSSKKLEKDLKEIRDKFTSSLGKDRGRVLLVRNKELFLKKIDELDEKLAAHGEAVQENLQQSIDDSKKAIVNIYVPILKDNHLEDMVIELGESPSDDTIKAWVTEQLNYVFPCAEELIKKMELRYDFKDLTYETLNKKEFVDNIKKAFKYENWDKAYKESIAASGIENSG
jgi:hypothetical protein